MSNAQDNPLRAERGSEVVEIAGETVVLGYDPDGEVWFVRTSSVPGLSATADTRDELLDELPFLIRQAMLP
jgi:hypothetical protein